MSLEGGKPYYLTSWSRAQFEPSRFPQSLNAVGGKAKLDDFDAPSGNLWTFRFIGSSASVFSDPKMAAALHTHGKGAGKRNAEAGAADNSSRCFTLGCLDLPGQGEKNTSKSQPIAFIGPDLSIVNDEGRAQLWQATPCPSLRASVPGEIPVHIRAHGSDKLLCSDEKRRTVYLLKKADAQIKDPQTGCYVFNDAWEATPDVDPPMEALQGLLKRLG